MEKMIKAAPRARCESVHAVSVKDFTSSIRDSFAKARPQIIQFSGHAVHGNFELSDGMADMIDPLFNESHSANTRLHGIVLNACKTVDIFEKHQNGTGLEEGTGFVVYTTKDLPVEAAACFSKEFYGTIVAGGSLLDSFAAGISQVKAKCPLCPDLYKLHIDKSKLGNIVASLAQQGAAEGASSVEVNDRGRQGGGGLADVAA